MDVKHGQLATVTLEIPASTKDKLERLAQATGRRQAALAVEAIDWYLDGQASQIAEIQEAIRRADVGEYAPEESVGAVREKFRAMGSALA